MGLLGKIWVKLGLDNSEFKQEIKESQGAAGKFKNSLGAIGSTIAAAFSVSAIISFGRKAVQEFAAAELAAAKLNSVLKATGGAVGLNTEQLQEYAREREKATAVDGDAIIEAMAKLASFKSIQGDVFKSAIASAQDLAEVWGTDLNAQILALGKALEDPERGLTALRRSGTMFTDEQIDGFKKLLAEGNKQQVQLEILAEIQKQYGGAAENAANTAIGGWKKVGIAWDNLMEDVGSGLQKTTGLAKILVGAIDGLNNLLNNTFRKGSIGYFLFGNWKNAGQANSANNAEAEAEERMKSIKSVAEAELLLADINESGAEGVTEYGAALSKMLVDYITNTNKATAAEAARQEQLKGSTLLIEEQIAALEKQKKEANTQAERNALDSKIKALREELDIKNGIISADELARKKALENAKLVKGTIPYQEKKIKLLQEDIALTNDDSKRASLSQELANLEHRLAVMKLTTAELKAYNDLIERAGKRGSKALPIVKNNIAPDRVKVTDKSFMKLPKDAQEKFSKSDAYKKRLEEGKKAVKDMEQMIEEVEALNQRFNDAIVFGISDAIQTLIDQLVKTGKVDVGSVVKALVSPFGDMLIQLGEVALMSAIGIDAIKESFRSMNPWVAAAAGVALIALGTAVKSGIAAIGASGGKSSIGNQNSFTGGYTPQPAMANQNAPDVMAVIKGEDIWLINQKVDNRKGR